MAIRRDFFELSRGRRRSAGPPAMLLVLMAFGVGGAATMMLSDTGLANWLLDGVSASAPVSVAQRSFPVCAGGARVTCVVDGDTFWLDGEKIRIADINTPEIGAPQCAKEAELGRQATSRLVQLLSAGPFDLAPADRDEDQYGRKLRVVERDGRSLGLVLVDEGLAHEWRGRREGWC